MSVRASSGSGAEPVLEQRRVLDRVGHGHRRHEALDVFMLDEHFVGLRPDDENLPLELVGRDAGTAGAAGAENRHAQDQKSPNSHHALNLQSEIILSAS
jgi:hypothetical protein